jgi:heme exporter protein B
VTTAGLVALIARRDLARMVARPGEWLLPAAFFLLIACLFPFAVGPDRDLLARLAPGILWVAALLAALLPVTTLYAADAGDGTLDQYAVRGVAGETLAVARIAALWIGLVLPLVLAFPLAALMLGLSSDLWGGLVLRLALALAGLSALAGIAAALTLGARGGGGLAALLVLPLAVPIIIFGAGPPDGSGLLWLAAAVLVLLAAAPFAIAQSLLAARG